MLAYRSFFQKILWSEKNIGSHLGHKCKDDKSTQIGTNIAKLKDIAVANRVINKSESVMKINVAQLKQVHRYAKLPPGEHYRVDSLTELIAI